MKTQSKLSKTYLVCILAFVCCLLWGSAFPCIKIGYNLFRISASDTSSQILFAGFRFILAGIFTIIIGSISRGKLLIPTGKALGKAAVLSIFQTILQYLCFYIGLAHTTGVKSSIIIGSNVFIAILVSSVVFRLENFTLRKIIGCIIGFAGVVLINLNGGGFDLNMSFMGEGLIFLSTFASAFSSVIMKKYSADENPVMLSGYQFLIGGIFMSVFGFASGGGVTGFTPASTAMLIYLGLVSAVAYSLWAILLKNNPVSKVVVFGFMNPVCGVVLSALLLHETEAFGLNAVFALVLVCGGIFIVNRQKEAAMQK